MKQGKMNSRGQLLPLKKRFTKAQLLRRLERIQDRAADRK